MDAVMMNPSYQLHELTGNIISPMRTAARLSKILLRSPFNPISYTAGGRTLAAGCELFERTTKRYSKPDFDLLETVVDGNPVSVSEKVVWRRPFCRLLNFKRKLPVSRPNDPKLLIVAPLSGHFATLLRGTVAEMMRNHDVYITDWVNARRVPVHSGNFDLNDYIDYVISMIRHLGTDVHVLAVCQSSVPVLAAVARMSETDDPCVPKTMTLSAGPVDTRINPTEVNRFAKERGLDWFRQHMIMQVPIPHAGVGRKVYPGFVQLSGFLGMNFGKHAEAHHSFFKNLVKGDGESAEKHREFYDEFLAVMDMTAEFYLQTVDEVFLHHDLPEGKFKHRGQLVKPELIAKTALLTIEGEQDDITGIGQTRAAHDLCSGLLESMQVHHEQEGVGHYGTFSGSRFREHIAPLISDFIGEHS